LNIGKLCNRNSCWRSFKFGYTPDAISLAASFAFIGFGLWGLRTEKIEEEKVKIPGLA